MFSEAMRQMYKLADTVLPEDEQNFAIYCFAFTQVNICQQLYKGAHLDGLSIVEYATSSSPGRNRYL
jgi:hypothetical protein